MGICYYIRCPKTVLQKTNRMQSHETIRPAQLSLLSRKYYFNETAFDSLMQKRIYNVLLVASNYDAFILENDGRIEERIFLEYMSLNLNYPPQFTQVPGEKEAFEVLQQKNIDLVIFMLSWDELGSFTAGEHIKAQYPDIPVVVLSPFSREVSLRVAYSQLKGIDYIFSWLGNSDLISAIVKLIEDRMNARHDMLDVGVQAILLIEDSVRFYSSYLPNLYKIVLKQSQTFMTEGLNAHQQMLRMRGRPKILLARNYEEAVEIYDEFKQHLLGVVSDINFNYKDTNCPDAGLKFLNYVRKQDEFMFFLLQSSEEKYEKVAHDLGVSFLNKNSKTLSLELRDFMVRYFAFGDFIFVDPDTNREVARASDLKTLQQQLLVIPDNVLEYHIYRNHLSKWLFARALFPLAEYFRDLRPEHFKDLAEIRQFLFEAIAGYRFNKGRGIIAEFNTESFDEFSTFSRIGEGSIGGKARGLAFLDSLIKRNRLFDRFPDVSISIPNTLVLTTDIFDEFMEINDLYKVTLAPLPDSEILEAFKLARIPQRLENSLKSLIQVTSKPIAVRSSSLLEDSYYQPFAGIYATYLVPSEQKNPSLMLDLLATAVKSVYASVFYQGSKAYMAATKNLIDEEKMAIVLQQIVGSHFDKYYFPTFSGVARSINFYPIEPEKPGDGVASIAIGLGEYIVGGGTTLRFSPKYPRKIMQLSTTEMALRETQKHFYALDLNPEHSDPQTTGNPNLIELDIEEAAVDMGFKDLVSTYDFENNQLREGTGIQGKRVVTFANILQHNSFPLAEILSTCLDIGQKEIGKPIEIEFAVDLHRPAGTPKAFYFLQIRPIVESKEVLTQNIEETPQEDTILESRSVLGNGLISDVFDIIYIKPETFNPARNQETVEQIAALNKKMLCERKNYILVGPGRWGSSDPWLGIPVKWQQISGARLIVESGLKNYRIDPSQGTHFFQNLTSFRVGYFTINPFRNDGFFDLDFLSQQPAEYEDDMIRHVRFPDPLIIKIDAQKNVGVVLKPGVEEPENEE